MGGGKGKGKECGPRQRREGGGEGMGGGKGKEKECGPRQRRGITFWLRFGRDSVNNSPCFSVCGRVSAVPSPERVSHVNAGLPRDSSITPRTALHPALPE